MERYCRDEWVKVNQPGELEHAGLMAYGDSPQQKLPQNGRQQVPDFAYNPHNESFGSEKNNSEPERKPKAIPPPRKDPPPRNTYSIPPQNVPRQREQKESNFDSERLASGRKQVQESYKEAENAKKQRKIQVMDMHELPKPKNTFFAKKQGSWFSREALVIGVDEFRLNNNPILGFSFLFFCRDRCIR